MVEYKRNYGIDLLRIVSMLMVVYLHVLKSSNMLFDHLIVGAKHDVLWLTEMAAYCAVNSYALISGYVGFGRRFKLSNILQLWMEVVFYLLVICLIYKAIAPSSVTVRQMITSFLPVLSNQYWYFTAYFAMFFFTPFLNLAVEKLSFEKSSYMLLAFLMVFSLISTLGGFKNLSQDAVVVKSGYSPLWLMIMYYMGAYIKKYRIAEKTPRCFSVIGYVSCVLISFLFCRNGKYHLMKYNSPTMVLCGVALLLIFARMRFGRNASRIIMYFSSATFGVYLIHMQDNNFEKIGGFIQGFKQLSVLRLMPAIFGVVIMIWFVCSLTDIVRQKLFKLLRIKRLAERMEVTLRRSAQHGVEIFKRRLAG